jgi:hypothetical protein
MQSKKNSELPTPSKKNISLVNSVVAFAEQQDAIYKNAVEIGKKQITNEADINIRLMDVKPDVPVPKHQIAPQIPGYAKEAYKFQSTMFNDVKSSEWDSKQMFPLSSSTMAKSVHLPSFSPKMEESKTEEFPKEQVKISRDKYTAKHIPSSGALVGDVRVGQAADEKDFFQPPTLGKREQIEIERLNAHKKQLEQQKAIRVEFLKEQIKSKSLTY